LEEAEQQWIYEDRYEYFDEFNVSVICLSAYIDFLHGILIEIKQKENMK